MIILFAPAKTMKKIGFFNQEDSAFPYDEVTRKIIDNLQSLDVFSLAKALHISSKQAVLIHGLYQGFSFLPAAQAFELFDGVAYKTLDYATLTKEAKMYLHQKVYIIDALYGLIKPNTSIKPYYLDMSYSGLNVRDLWRPILHSWMDNQKHQQQDILSLTSKEYRGLLAKNSPIYEVEFLDCEAGECKAVSVFSKQMRGKLLRYLATHNVEKIIDLPLRFEGYTLERNQQTLTYKRLVS